MIVRIHVAVGMGATGPTLTHQFSLHEIRFRGIACLRVLAIAADVKPAVIDCVVLWGEGSPAPRVAVWAGDGGEEGVFAGVRVCRTGGGADNFRCHVRIVIGTRVMRW